VDGWEAEWPDVRDYSLLGARGGVVHDDACLCHVLCMYLLQCAGQWCHHGWMMGLAGMDWDGKVSGKRKRDFSCMQPGFDGCARWSCGAKEEKCEMSGCRRPRQAGSAGGASAEAEGSERTVARERAARGRWDGWMETASWGRVKVKPGGQGVWAACCRRRKRANQRHGLGGRC